MTKVKKLKKKKKYRYDLNRKRMNKRRFCKLKSAELLKTWDPLSSTQKNFKKMGLAFDLNKDIKLKNREGDAPVKKASVKKAQSTTAIKDLEQYAETEKTSETKNFRFSQDEANFLSYLLGKYGDDYKAMSRDKKNYLQHTWKKLRYKINLFKSIPEHYKAYLKSKKNSNE